jgi:hypothetical protein
MTPNLMCKRNQIHYDARFYNIVIETEYRSGRYENVLLCKVFNYALCDDLRVSAVVCSGR